MSGSGEKDYLLNGPHSADILIIVNIYRKSYIHLIYFL